jgi:hypothetical protein
VAETPLAVKILAATKKITSITSGVIPKTKRAPKAPPMTPPIAVAEKLASAQGAVLRSVVA